MEKSRISRFETISAQYSFPSTTSDIEKVLNKTISRRGSKKSKSKTSRLYSLINEDDLTVLSEEELKVLIVNDIQEEIIKNALDEVYERYLEKQTVYFISHCSRLAWIALIEWNFQKKDKSGFREFDRERFDTEPMTSPKDSWTGHSIQIDQRQRKVSHFSQVDDSLGDRSMMYRDTIPDSSRKGSPEIKPPKAVTLTNQFDKPVKFTKKTAKKPEKKVSARFRKSEEFPRALEGRVLRADDMRKDSYELPAPAPLQPKHFPSSRVEVQYAIMPGNPSKGLARQKELQIKTIVLKKPKESNELNSIYI